MGNRRADYLTLLLVFVIGIISVFTFRLWQVKKVKPISFSPQQSSFTLKPPSQALKGKLLSVKGDVKKEPREKDEFEEVKVEEEILQGEKLATGEKSKTTVEFPDFAKIDLGANTEIGFINLIPADFLLSQSSGSVTYKLLQDNNPLGVRSLHALLTLNSGKTEVAVNQEKITVKVLSGETKLALVDLDNKTHIWQLKEGQKALITDAQRRVEIK